MASRSLAAMILKDRGHDLINQLVALGIPRQRVYDKLAKRMGTPSLAHFSAVNDILTLNRMVLNLTTMVRIAQKKETGVKEKERYDYSQMFTDKTVLRAVGRKNQRIARWRRILMTLGDILFR